MTSKIRHSRINQLHKAAKTGKYTWDDLKAKARSMGASEPTVRSYMDEVRSRLRKEGYDV